MTIPCEQATARAPSELSELLELQRALRIRSMLQYWRIHFEAGVCAVLRDVGFKAEDLINFKIVLGRIVKKYEWELIRILRDATNETKLVSLTSAAGIAGDASRNAKELPPGVELSAVQGISESFTEFLLCMLGPSNQLSNFWRHVKEIYVVALAHDTMPADMLQTPEGCSVLLSEMPTQPDFEALAKVVSVTLKRLGSNDFGKLLHVKRFPSHAVIKSTYISAVTT